MILVENLTIQSIWAPCKNWFYFFKPTPEHRGFGWNLYHWIVRVTWR